METASPEGPPHLASSSLRLSLGTRQGLGTSPAEDLAYYEFDFNTLLAVTSLLGIRHVTPLRHVEAERG